MIRDDRQRGGDERWRARLARSDASARPVDLVEAMALEPSHLLIEVVGAGPEQFLVAEGTADAMATLARPGLGGVVRRRRGPGAAGPTVRSDGAHAR